MELKKLADIKMAKLLYKLKFYGNCEHFLWIDSKKIEEARYSANTSYNNNSPYTDYIENNKKVHTITVPYLTQVQDWLRDEHNINLFIIGTEKGYTAITGMNRLSKPIINIKKEYYPALRVALRKILINIQ